MKNIKALGTGCADDKTAMEFIEDEKGEIAMADALALPKIPMSIGNNP